MAAGRCAGCGRTGSSKRINTHVLGCDGYRQLFQLAPERCLDPAAEYRRFKAEDDTSEARAERRDARLQQRFADMDAEQSRQAQRWRKPADILADD